MALDTSVNEDNWILQRDGSRQEISVSAIPGASTTITWQVTSLEHKYFCITVTAAQSYKTANPSLDLDLEIIANMPNACHIIRRTETRTLESVAYA
jgi:hypothetical protein